MTKFIETCASLFAVSSTVIGDRYLEQISGKLPHRERKKQIPIHLMKVRALKERIRVERKERERDRESIGHQSAAGDSRPRREYLSLYFPSGIYTVLLQKRERFL